MIGVGSKVVCVDDAARMRKCDGHSSLNRKPFGYVKRGEIYVVEGFRVDRFGRLGFIIIGKPVIGQNGGNMGWFADRFRELEHEQMRAELEYRRQHPETIPDVAEKVREFGRE